MPITSVSPFSTLFSKVFIQGFLKHGNPRNNNITKEVPYGFCSLKCNLAVSCTEIKHAKPIDTITSGTACTSTCSKYLDLDLLLVLIKNTFM